MMKPVCNQRDIRNDQQVLDLVSILESGMDINRGLVALGP